MVGAAGFEPTTFRTRTERATKLRYAPHVLLYYNLGGISIFIKRILVIC